MSRAYHDQYHPGDDVAADRWCDVAADRWCEQPMTETIADIRYVFCYGTLRPGCGNHRLWVERATGLYDGAAVVPGYALVTGGAFPYAVPAAMSQTVGCLLAVHDETLLADLDWLEGYRAGGQHNHYDRIVVPVITPDGPVRAWMYVAARERDRLLDDVPTNEAGMFDWHEHRRARR